MNFLQKLNIEPAKFWKLLGLAVATVVGAVFIVSLAHSVFNFNGFSPKAGMMGMTRVSQPQMGDFAVAPSFSVSEGPVSYDEGYAGNVTYGKGGGSMGMDMPTLSIRNINPSIPPSYTSGSPIGNTAEEFEVSDYSATFEAGNLSETCGKIAGLKSKDEVIFENSYESDLECFYTFKVEKADVAEVLNALKALNPRDLSENTSTIKKQLDDFTNETEILTKKLASVEATLTSALASYDEITRLATQTKDAESLARIINSKIQVIERLAQERMNINQQLDYLARAKAEKLDKVDYTYFSVSVYRNQYFDWKNIYYSWKGALQELIWSLNTAIQNATVGVLGFLFAAVPYLIYLLLLVLAAKYGWRLAKYIWSK